LAFARIPNLLMVALMAALLEPARRARLLRDLRTCWSFTENRLACWRVVLTMTSEIQYICACGAKAMGLAFEASRNDQCTNPAVKAWACWPVGCRCVM